MNKAIVLVMVLLLVFSVSVIRAEDSEVHTSGDYQYVILDDGTAEIRTYQGRTVDLDIPDSLDGVIVSRIGDMAFSMGYNLNSVTIPNSITKVGINPFRGCNWLSSISVSPDHPTLATFDGALFSITDKRLVCYPHASAAEQFEIPQGISIIGDWAFIYCDRLKRIAIPESVNTIGEAAFMGCESLASINIPDSVTTIGEVAFMGCNRLTSVVVPDSAVTVGYGVFASCSGLTNIYVSPDHPTLATINGVLFDKTEKKLVCYPCAFKTSEYAIPQGITAIGSGAFYDCSSLTSIVIPDSVTTIGEWAFTSCSGLTNITIPNSITTIGKEAFHGCTNILITVSRNSYAAQYCKDNNLPYTYPDAMDWLND